MLVLGFDTETTGLDPEEDRIIEAGAVMWDTDFNQPVGIFNWLIKVDVDIPPETTQVHGITKDVLDKYGHDPSPTFEQINELMNAADYIVAHNGNSFDKPFFYHELIRHDVMKMTDTPWLDTRTDLPWKNPPNQNNLAYLAATMEPMGFVNPFPHRAVTDVLTMLKVMSQFNFQDIVDYYNEPSLVVRAMGFGGHPSDAPKREAAKKLGFRWQDLDGERFEKWWVQRIKESRLKELQLLAEGQDISVVDIKEWKPTSHPMSI